MNLLPGSESSAEPHKVACAISDVGGDHRPAGPTRTDLVLRAATFGMTVTLQAVLVFSGVNFVRDMFDTPPPNEPKPVVIVDDEAPQRGPIVEEQLSDFTTRFAALRDAR